MMSNLQAGDQVSGITACTVVDSATNNEEIKGFQLYYGTGTNQVAGPAHGDTVQGCTNYVISDSVGTIEMYYDTTGTILEGISFAFQNSGAVPLDIGTFPVSGQ